MITAMKKNLTDLSYPLPNTISKLPDKVSTWSVRPFHGLTSFFKVFIF